MPLLRPYARADQTRKKNPLQLLPTVPTSVHRRPRFHIFDIFIFHASFPRTRIFFHRRSLLYFYLRRKKSCLILSRNNFSDKDTFQYRFRYTGLYYSKFRVSVGRRKLRSRTMRGLNLGDRLFTAGNKRENSVGRIPVGERFGHRTFADRDRGKL